MNIHTEIEHLDRLVRAARTLEELADMDQSYSETELASFCRHGRRYARRARLKRRGAARLRRSAARLARRLAKYLEASYVPIV